MYNAKVGSFNIDPAVTVGNTQSVIDVGFEPKIVLFWWSGSTATGDEVAGGTINIGFGAAIDSTHRFNINGVSVDALTDSDSYRNQVSTSVILIYIDGTPTIDGIADFDSMTANGFNLMIDDQFTNAYRISYLALGGDDLTNAFISNQQQNNATGNYQIAGVGFKPDALLVVSSVQTAINSGGTNLHIVLGMATSSSNQGIISGRTADAQASMVTSGYGYNGEINACISAVSISKRETFVQFDDDGFTLNTLEGTAQYYYFYIALKGGQYSVGDIITRTDGNDIAETVGFQPTALLFASVNRTLSTQDAANVHNRISIGASTSVINCTAQAISDETGLTDSETAHANYDSAVYAHVIDDDTTGIMDLKSIESDGFTCVMTENDASACWVTYLAIGATGESSSSSSSSTSSTTSSSSSESSSSSSSSTTTSSSSYSAIPGEPTTITTTTTATVVDWCEPP